MSGHSLTRIIHEASTARADKADLTGVLGLRALRRSAPTTSRALGPAGARDLGLLRALATNPHDQSGLKAFLSRRRGEEQANLGGRRRCGRADGRTGMPEHLLHWQADCAEVVCR